MNKHRVGVLGASGYSGAELLRYLAGHPALDVAWVTADANAGKCVGEVFGHLIGLTDFVLAPTNLQQAPDLDVAFLALPHGQAALHGKALAESGVKVVDLSADWRLHDAAAYDEWYGWSHPVPEELGGWVYGLPELHRDRIGGANAIANPGCYPSAALLALAPLLQAGVVEADGIVIDATSGVSGAGRKIDADYLFSELDASYSAYRVGHHQHTPEIEQELTSAAGTDVRITFTPHLAPMARGLLATCYARTTSDVDALRNALEIAYKGEPFVHVVARQPSTKQVSGTNHALIGIGSDPRTGTAIVTCAIDNLGKGAAGQAVQNANIMLGLEETLGLSSLGVYP